MNYGPKVKAYCAKHGIDLTENDWPAAYDLCVTTPYGKILRSVGDHSAVTHMYKEPGLTKNDVWKEVWEDLSMGITDCDIPNCEMCAEMKEESQSP
jgi:hypothetical protein